MFSMKQRFWYIARRSSAKAVVYLITATSYKSAVRSMGSLSNAYDIRPISWRHLTLLLGCLKPVGKADTETATGDLLIIKQGHSIIVRAGD